MSEENQLQTEEQASQAAPVSQAEPSEVQPVEAQPSAEQPATEIPASSSTPTPTQPQVIIQTERGFSHYVGFALLCVLCVCFYFLPGIFITFGVSRLVDLNGAAAWIFSAILSVVIWLIFKLKIKGFKKSFLFYIALCVLILIGLVAIQVGLDYNIFSEIFALLSGAKA